ncbi:MAG: CPBP family intramembrane metalloprotease [Nitriliruptoraceae bacterium]|nr:CPBP family intramembrane metalloprotease [Nitriliruptoraceae bacterium]
MQPPLPPPGAVEEPAESTPVGEPTLRQSGRVLLFTLVYAAAFVGLLAAAVRVAPTEPSGFALLIVGGTGLGAAAGLAVHVHLLRRDGLSLAALGFRRPTWGLLHLLWQIPLIIAGSLIVPAIVLGLLLRQEPPPAGLIDDVVMSANWLVLVGVLLVIAVVTPLWEEVVFRGLLFSSLTRTMPTIMAAILSSGVFALVHGVPLLMLSQFLAGLGYCWLYAWHRVLWAPIALHMANNSLAAVVVSLG